MLPVIEISLPAQLGSTSTNVPAFLAKLWKMVDNPDADNLICWTDDGNSFTIKNQGEFTKTLLPYYYKHSNMASFVRQLNMYGFHKVMSVESGGLKGDKDEVEFAHPYFLRGQEHLLDQIKRKVTIPNSRSGGLPTQYVPSIKNEKVTEVLSEVAVIKERQEDLDTKMENMRSENEALWGEVLSLRQKHHQQQKIVNKLIQFLSALLQPRGMKRSFGRGPGTSSHVAQLALPLDTEADTAAVPVAAKAPKLAESSGPIIQELPANLDTSQLAAVLSNLHSSPAPEPEQVVEIIVDQGVAPQPAPTASLVSPGPLVQEQGAGASKYMMVDPVSVNSSLVKRPVLQREMSVEDFDTVINTNEKELDNLKDILSGQITLDTSLVSSLFTADQDPNSMPLFSDFMLPESNNDDNTGTSDTGADVKSVTYNPSSFFELADDGDGNILHSSHNSLFDDTVLHTPMIQEDQTDPMKMFKK